jgi:PAT family beta-lactamase induction signal transducer AmpG
MVGAASGAWLLRWCYRRLAAARCALRSGVYALSRSLLAAPAGFVASEVGWSRFFLYTVAAAVPAFLLMTRLTPWNREIAKGTFVPERD